VILYLILATIFLSLLIFFSFLLSIWESISKKAKGKAKTKVLMFRFNPYGKINNFIVYFINSFVFSIINIIIAFIVGFVILYLFTHDLSSAETGPAYGLLFVGHIFTIPNAILMQIIFQFFLGIMLINKKNFKLRSVYLFLFSTITLPMIYLLFILLSNQALESVKS
jgi:hypothetical protein